MSIVLGPILYARATTDPNLWCFDVHVTVDADGAPSLKFADGTGVDVSRQPEQRARFEHGWTVWAWQVTVKRGDDERQLAYTIMGEGVGDRLEIDAVAVPPKGYLPRIAMFSCSGFAHAKDARKLAEPAKLWRDMQARHREGMHQPTPDNPSGIHLLIGGGDQVYCDELPSLIELDSMPGRKRKNLGRNATFGRRIEREYLAQYSKVWHDLEPIADMLARVPGVFTWDDHDIFDGWGSHEKEIREHPRYQQVYEAARRAFIAFQLGGDPDEQVQPVTPLVTRATHPTREDDHLLQWLELRGADAALDIVLLDIRSHRTREQVMSQGQWSALLERTQRYINESASLPRNRHVLVVSAIPVVYMRFGAASWILSNLVPGVQGIEDDLIDQWEHGQHQGERARLIMSLLTLRQRAAAQVTLLSGDVHVASAGRIVSTLQQHTVGDEPEATIIQITSSAIVNNPPKGREMALMSIAGAEGRDHVSNGVFTELVDVDPGRLRLPLRNYVAIGFDRPSEDGDALAETGRLWADWVVWDGRRRKQIVVNPVREEVPVG